MCLLKKYYLQTVADIMPVWLVPNPFGRCISGLHRSVTNIRGCKLYFNFAGFSIKLRVTSLGGVGTTPSQ